VPFNTNQTTCIVSAAVCWFTVHLCVCVCVCV